MASFATLLERHPGVMADAELSDYARRVARNSVRMGRLVDELLHYVRLGRQPLEPERVSLQDEVSALVAELGEQQPGRRIRWDIGPLPEVRADPTLIRLVLRNLLENAVKYTSSRDEARIELWARESGQEVQVAVRDNGVGFDMAYAGKLFAPFERLHAEGAYEGTGIGLAHARRIVERHAGRIWCDAAPGRGATFEFSLPR
jgi:light-regulated signal transduction histidine kinase (bacteriophytochrome)